ncbi:MAG: type II secretion system protein GspG [SAR324 cluster bacterium]|nr:type II secretion system protein GspG [SAR324 cluster bacterium]
MKKTTKTQQRRWGFSLMEVMVSLGVISILAGTMAPITSMVNDTVKSSNTKKEVFNLEASLQSYYKDEGRFPANLIDLVIDPTVPPAVSTWKGPYASGSTTSIKRDAWGNDYIYTPDPAVMYKATLKSNGPDGKPSTSDDLTYMISAKTVYDKAKDKVIDDNTTLMNAGLGQIPLFDELVDNNNCSVSNFLSIPTTAIKIKASIANATEWINLRAKCGTNCAADKHCPSAFMEMFQSIPARDAWGNFMSWDVNERHFYSRGPDGKTSTAAEKLDDIHPAY